MATICPECAQIPIGDLLNAKGLLENPGCSTCDGGGIVGNPEECSDDIPLCYGRALNGSDQCTCENGFMAKANRRYQECSLREAVYLLKEADARLGGYERVIWDLAHGRPHLAGLLEAQAVIDDLAGAARGSRLKNREYYSGGSPFHLGQLAGFDSGMRQALLMVRAALSGAIQKHREANRLPEEGHGPTIDLRNTSGELRPQIAQQIRLPF